MLLNCGVGKTLESPLDFKEIQPVYPKGNQSWIFIGRTDAEAETPILWPSNAKNWLTRKDWRWERLKAGGEGDDRRWDGWMASLTQWACVWVDSRSWWWTGRPGVHGVAESDTTERLNWTELQHLWASSLIYEINLDSVTLKFFVYSHICVFRVWCIMFYIVALK